MSKKNDNSISFDRFELIKPSKVQEWFREHGETKQFKDVIGSLTKSNPHSVDLVYHATPSILWLEMAVEGLIKLLPESESLRSSIPFNGDFEVFEGDGIRQWVKANDAGRLIYGCLYEFECISCGAIIKMEIPNKFPTQCPNTECGKKKGFLRAYPAELEEPLWLPAGKLIEADTETIFNEIVEFSKAHLVIRDVEHDVLGLWILASYIVDDFTTCPYLAMTAPMSSGKTQVLEVIRQLAYRAYSVVDASQSALFRAINQSHITLCIDEAQESMNQKTEHAATIRACMLSGYKRGVGALRNDDSSGEWIPKNFDLFGFKAFSGTEVLIPALASRSIEFRMHKAKPKNIRIDAEWSEKIRSMLVHWRFQTLHKLSIVDPDIEDGRLIELFSPLYTVEQGFGCDSLHAMLEETQNTNVEDERQSIESEIAMIVVDLADEVYGLNGFGERTTIAPTEIVERLGWESKKSSVISVGRYLKVLGIPTRRTHYGRVIDLGDPVIQTGIDQLRERYA